MFDNMASKSGAFSPQGTLLTIALTPVGVQNFLRLD